MTRLDAVEDFRRSFLAFYFGRFQHVPVRSTSVIEVHKGGSSENHPRGQYLTRVEAASALGYMLANHFRLYAITWTYDFKYRSKNLDKVGRQFGIGPRRVQQLTREFWELMHKHCLGRLPWQESAPRAP